MLMAEKQAKWLQELKAAAVEQRKLKQKQLESFLMGRQRAKVMN